MEFEGGDCSCGLGGTTLICHCMCHKVRKLGAQKAYAHQMLKHFTQT